MSRILVVEDDPALLAGLEDDLKFEGYSVETCTDGITALARARSTHFDLIVLDVMLPGKDGLEICRELRRSAVRTPVILLTARAQESDRVLGLEIGADDYVTKPFSPRELRARIKAILRRVDGDVDRYRFGDMEADFTRGELRRGDQPIEATAMEMKLLSAFVRNRGRVLTRDQLLDHAWGHDTHVGDRVVDTHILNLRKKIEPAPAEPRYIVSVRGLGYRFDG
jgi:DNA-binding response OmpR family regulator